MYTARWSPSAAKFFQKLDRVLKDLVIEKFEPVLVDPLSAPGTRPLKGEFAGCRRLRIGSLRLIYRFDPPTQIVDVLRLIARDKAYR